MRLPITHFFVISITTRPLITLQLQRNSANLNYTLTIYHISGPIEVVTGTLSFKSANRCRVMLSSFASFFSAVTHNVSAGTLFEHIITEDATDTSKSFSKEK